MAMNKLTEIQVRLKAPKDKKNTFGGYTYRSAESILEAVKPLLKDTKTALVLNDRIELIGERIYVRAERTLWDSETDLLIRTATAFRREPEMKKGADESQITGAASSYARKYALNGLFAIDDNKDPDTDEYQAPEKKTEQAVEKALRNKKEEPKEEVRTEPIVPLQWQNRVCEICGTPLEPKVAKRSHEVFHTHMFCSRECAEKGNNGLPRDEISDIQADIEKKLKGKNK